MPFPTRYTRIPYIADDGIDIQLDRARGHFWTFTGGGYSYHDPDYETFEDGPNFFKIRASDGVVLASGRGPLVSWDYEEVHYGEDQSTNFEVWNFAIAPSTGNLYVSVDNRYTSQSYIHCMDPTDFHILFSSPVLSPATTGLAHCCDWLYIVEPYIYGMSYRPGGTPALQILWTRLPLSLAQFDWTAVTYSGFEGFEAPIDGNIAIDSTGFLWSACMKTLAKVSPTGVVTTYNLAASLHVDACIQTVGYDPGTNTLGLYVKLRVGGTGAITPPGMQIVKVNCATGAVIATFSPPAGLSINGDSLVRAWENIQDGHVLLKCARTTANTLENRGTVVDFDLRSMSIVQLWQLQRDWGLDATPVEPVYAESPLLCAQSTYEVIPDFSGNVIWAYNGWHGWIYPDAEYPSGSYGVWAWSTVMPPPLPPCPEPAWAAYFHDVALDPYISYGCKLKLKFQTFITRMREGHEERIGEWQDPLWTFDITPALRDQADLDYLIAFFRARNGPEFIFKFLNPLDYQVSNQFFGVGDGITKVFQLSRQYATGLPGDGLYYVRPIILPDLGVQVYDNGVLVEEGLYAVCPLGGTIVFATAPLSGHVLTWTGMYYTPVRFQTNRVYSVVEHYEHFEDQIVLVEERLGASEPVPAEEESPDFVEVQFPVLYAQRATMGPEQDVVTVTSDSGGTSRTLQFRDAKIRFTVEETEQPQAVMQSLMAFFLNRKGRLYGFRARDITDFELASETMQSADGVRTEFHLVKNYSSGAQTQVRTITKPASDVTISVGGVLASPQPAIDLGTGKVTFASPPASGAVITCSGTFDVPVRFDSDEIIFSIQGFEAFNLEAIGLLETELGLPQFTIEALTT